MSAKTWALSAAAKNRFASNQKPEGEVAPEPEQERTSFVNRQACRSGFTVRPGASNRRAMIENIAVTVNAVLVEVEKGCLHSRI